MTAVESQEKRILAHLKAGHILTARQASNLFLCDRLAARIHSLRRRHRIDSAMVKVPSGKRIAVYSAWSTKRKASGVVS